MTRAMSLFREKFAAEYPGHPWLEMWREEEEREHRAAWDALTERQRGDYRMAAAIFDVPWDEDTPEEEMDAAVRRAAFFRFAADRRRAGK